LLVALAFVFSALLVSAQRVQDPPFGRPDAIADLATEEGAQTVRGVWRYHDVHMVPASSRGNGADYTPRAGAAGFDDSKWESIKASTLGQRRSKGNALFSWYRINITVPDHVAGFTTTGSTIAFEIVINGYAEVWINGRMSRVPSQPGGQIVKGFDVPNRVVLTRNAAPGQKIQLAIFGINGPISASSESSGQIKSATLDFYRSPNIALSRAPAQVQRTDPAIDEIVPQNATIEKLAGGFLFTEGPIWVPKTQDEDGYLLFSDPYNNIIYRWTQDGALSIFMTKSGYRGADIGEYSQPGSNGLTVDPQGRLTINQQGNRRVVRLEKDGKLTVLADRYDGKRFNSPNDLVYKSDGALYFTDPPFGLPKYADDPRKELLYSGVYRVSPDGKNIRLLTTELKGPNGLAFSPDEKYLYVDDWDLAHKVVMRYEVQPDGSLANGKVFFDMTSTPGQSALDGMKVDQKGNLYVTGPDGVWIISPEGKHLGTLVPPEHANNVGWGDDDGKTLYLCTRTGLYRIRLQIPGTGHR